MNIVIIGGGFFGSYLAEYASLRGHKVVLLEEAAELMTRASKINQARVHNGYHYPRSVLTGLSSAMSFPRFVAEFKDSIVSDFSMYYMIGMALSKVTAKQFRFFCERIGAPYEPAPSAIRKLTNPSLIEDVFSVTEYAFDVNALRRTMEARLAAAKVNVTLNARATRVESSSEGLKVLYEIAGESGCVAADHVFNCTYSYLNCLLSRSSVELVPLKHEMTEMCLVDVPEHLKKIGITVMCGPFFSVMPFPSARLHSFSHVRYTPHFEWTDSPSGPYEDAENVYESCARDTAWRLMVRDASRYIPSLIDCEYRDSIWEVKTVLPRSESDDSRPILFLPNYGMKGLHCIMGGKIDNVYDAVSAIEKSLNL